MEAESTNLRLILDHFGISYKAVADALNVHATQVSRWASGDRQLRVSAQAMEPLADFILSRDLVPEDLAWMRKAFARDGFDTEFTSMPHVKRCLILWLACDGRDIKRIFWSQHDASGKTMAESGGGVGPGMGNPHRRPCERKTRKRKACGSGNAARTAQNQAFLAASR